MGHPDCAGSCLGPVGLRWFGLLCLSQDALHEVGGGLGAGSFEEFEPGGSALGVGHAVAAGGAGGEVPVEEGLVGVGEGLVESVGEHLFAGEAVGTASAARIGWIGEGIEFEDFCHVVHLIFY